MLQLKWSFTVCECILGDFGLGLAKMRKLWPALISQAWLQIEIISVITKGVSCQNALIELLFNQEALVLHALGVL